MRLNYLGSLRTRGCTDLAILLKKTKVKQKNTNYAPVMRDRCPARNLMGVTRKGNILSSPNMPSISPALSLIGISAAQASASWITTAVSHSRLYRETRTGKFEWRLKLIKHHNRRPP